MRVPASVLLAVLAAAGLLALAPALVRRYDATERLAAERAQSTARVLQRRRRRRSVPGREPVKPPRTRIVTVRSDDSPVSAPPAPTRRAAGLRLVPRVTGRSRRRPPLRRHTPAIYRRRRVLAALLLLNLVELVGVVLVSSGFWISFSVTATLLAVYLVHLRGRAIADQRRRRAEAREAAWLAVRQAEVRRAQARRAQARREAQRRLAAQRELVRRAALGLDQIADLPRAASGGAGRTGGAADRAAGGTGRPGGSVSYRRAGGLRGRPYEL
ncbi:divisome protein SepX/GlpR [Plantactinospora sonchi]|uniref:Integral membrane protein n=1 Tax=Plantactinospora sonchi TaxID=1544735 RepID=A0ABU7RSP1_9ACTN